MTVQFEEILTHARQLTPHERARLIATLAEELVSAPVPAVRSPHDPWVQWDALREVFRAIGQTSPTAGEQLDRDRQARDDMLMGLAGADDVHA